MPILPQAHGMNDSSCRYTTTNTEAVDDETAWCTRALFSSDNQVCPMVRKRDDDEGYNLINSQELCDSVIINDTEVPEGLAM